MSPQPAHPRHNAFTLVELLVVIGIIAILIGLLVTVIPKIRKAAYGAATSSQLSAISSAIQQYYGDYKAYPGPLGNNQLGIQFDPTSSVNSTTPNAAGFPLTAIPYVPGTPSTPAVNPDQIIISNTQLLHITGAQNLVLGLLGGLEVQVGSNGSPTAFVYDPDVILPDGATPGPIGAASLNPNSPRRQQAYIQVKRGEISVPSMAFNSGNGASFADPANRSPNDAPIPVFLDKWPDPMPILYIRTNVGGKAIVGVRNTDGNTQLVDPSAQGNYGYTVNEVPQYDLCQVLGYTLANSNNNPAGPFGVNLTSSSPYHGLQGLGNQSLSTTPIDTIATGYANQGKNGVAYFRDPNFVANASGSYDPLADNRHNGVAREKDGYLLIAAGADRAYGTTDDAIFPGTLLVAQ